MSDSTEARLDAIEAKLDSLLALVAPAESAPLAVAAMVDVVDERVSALQARGIHPEERMARLTEALVVMTGAPVVDALEAGALMVPEAPGFAAMVVDVVDEYASGLQEQGIDINAVLSNAMRSALRLGTALGEREMEALDVLLSSQALSLEAARLVSAAAEAVVDGTRQDVKPLGLLGLLKALRDEEVGRALALAVDVARRTGATLGTTAAPARP
jgi:Protein of unknown function (DUF1641)